MKQNIRMAKTPEECNVITHGGRFHGDELMACAILSFIEPIVVLRTRDRKILSSKRADPNTYFLDVGNTYEPSQNMFDHHQSGFKRKRPKTVIDLPRPDKDGNWRKERGGIPYATAGLVWDCFGEIILQQTYGCSDDEVREIFARVDRALIQGIDARDYNLEPNTLSLSVSGVLSMANHRWDDDYNQEDRFVVAAGMAKRFLDWTILMARSHERGKRYVEDLVRKIDDDSTEVLVLPQFIGGWQSTIAAMDSEAARRLKFVVYKDTELNRYDAHAIPVHWSEDDEIEAEFSAEFGVELEENFGRDRREYRMKFPNQWRGSQYRRLARITGVETACHCRNSGALAAARTEDDAVELAKRAIQLADREAA